MQWSQIKTLFILCFLVLDIYLVIQFFDKQDKNDLDVMEQQESTIEQQLSLEDIKLPTLPDEELEESYISVQQKKFSETDLRKINSTDNQKITVVKDTLLVSKFDKPIKIKDSDDAKEVIMSNVMESDDYDYWDWNKDLNVIIFFQKKHDQPIYYNEKGLLLAFLNDNDEMVGYTQTMLGKENKDFDNSKKLLIKPIRAIDTLYNRNELYSGEKITSAKIGYYTTQPIATSEDQTFAPTWKITVNGERNYFIHAIEGFVFPMDDVTFLKDSMTSIKGSLATIQKDKDFKNIIKQLDMKLEMINRSEAK
ncbi:two-component system regulatory protein YycI [Lentibacillus sp. N15]|uniref:two-component system regulatory protein YycI n=1 Tax=Lentibacillus songyuanensis TaxID=3136161 RepID=UPI0031BB9277